MALKDDAKIIDLNIDGIQKQRFRINGDPNSIIELNTSDMGIGDRLQTGLQKLQEKMSEIAELSDDDEELSDKMKKANEVMCEWVDYIFDSPISQVLSKGGTMYDPKDGMFRYEHIIDGLTKLYSDNINKEYKAIQARIKKHTSKYAGKKKGK